MEMNQNSLEVNLLCWPFDFGPKRDQISGQSIAWAVFRLPDWGVKGLCVSRLYLQQISQVARLAAEFCSDRKKKTKKKTRGRWTVSNPILTLLTVQFVPTTARREPTGSPKLLTLLTSNSRRLQAKRDP